MQQTLEGYGLGVYEGPMITVFGHFSSEQGSPGLFYGVFLESDRTGNGRVPTTRKPYTLPANTEQ